MARANQTRLQTSASLNLTVWAWRWKTPRSSARKIRTHAMKPTQCQPVIATRASMSPHQRLLPRGNRRAFNDAHLRPCANVRALTLMPPEDQGAGDIDAGVSAGDDADEEGEREVVDRAAAKDEQRQGGQEHRAGGDHRAGQGLIEPLVHDLAEGAAKAQLQVLANRSEERR